MLCFYYSKIMKNNVKTHLWISFFAENFNNFVATDKNEQKRTGKIGSKREYDKMSSWSLSTWSKLNSMNWIDKNLAFVTIFQ